MNYIAELNAFYDKLELNPLPTPCIALWHALMAIANKSGWQQEFTVATSVLMLKSGLNAKAVQRARNQLEQAGYISWKSRGGNQSATYQMISRVGQNKSNSVLQNVAENVPQNVVQIVPQNVPQSVPINKYKQNIETKKEVSKDTKKKFIPPTLDEVRAYCLERQNNIDPQKFIDFYAANGWVQGKGKPIKDWKACIRTWEKNTISKEQQQNKPVNKFNAFPQRNYSQEDYADIERRLLQRGVL